MPSEWAKQQITVDGEVVGSWARPQRQVTQDAAGAVQELLTPVTD